MNVIPISEHEQRGTFRADRHQAMRLKPIKPPSPPRFLNSVARKKFKELAKLLANSGILTELDTEALTCFSAAFATWRTASEEVEKDGATYRHGGLIKVHPSVAIMQQAARELQTWADKLALTPSARRRMRIDLDAQKPKGISARDRSKGPPAPDKEKLG